jgi:hypothetical protein
MATIAETPATIAETPVSEPVSEPASEPVSEPASIEESAPQEQKSAPPFPVPVADSPTLKFIAAHKQHVIAVIGDRANSYLNTIRISDKTLTIDAQAKDQIMCIFTNLLDTVADVADSVGTGADPDAAIAAKYSPTTTQYKAWKFVKNAGTGHEYNLVGERVEEDMLEIITERVEGEDLAQYTVELFMLFVNTFARALANYKWDTTQRVSSKHTSSILRIMDGGRTDPEFFNGLYSFAEQCKALNTKK